VAAFLDHRDLRRPAAAGEIPTERGAQRFELAGSVRGSRAP